MKKIVSLVLALALVLTAAVCLVSAEEEAETPVSAGKSYTVAKGDGEATYWSMWDNSITLEDDGKILTDGNKGSLDGPSHDYVALNGLSGDGAYVKIVVDLGEAKNVGKFAAYTASNKGEASWGISESHFVRVKVSTDGETFTEAGYNENGQTVFAGTGADGTWNSYESVITLEEAVSARYVEFDLYNYGSFCWVEEVEVYAGDDPSQPTPEFPVFPDSLWEVFNADDAVIADGVENGKFQGSDSDCGDAFAYLYASDSSNVYVAIATNYAGIGTPESKGNGAGTNIRLWFRTNDEATVYTHFVDIQYDGDETPSTFGKKCGQLHANADTVEISTEGVAAEAVSGSNTLFMQAKIPFSVIEATEDFGMFITVSNGKTENIPNNAIIAPFDPDCTFAKTEGMDRTKNNTFFPYTSWNDAAIVIEVGAEPVEESSDAPVEESSNEPVEESSEAPAESEEESSQGGNTPTTGDAGLIALAVVSVLALGGAVIVKKSK